MASCPLCGAEMTIDTCPRCVGLHVDGRPLDLPHRPGEDGEPAPMVVATLEPAEDHGYVPAAAIFGAQGLVALLFAGVGAPPDVPLAVISFVIAAALLKGAGWAKWMVLVGAALSITKLAFAFVLTGSWVAVFAMLPSLCVLGAFWLDSPGRRMAASAAGVLLAFSWLVLVATRSEISTGPEDALAQYAIPGGTWADPALGVTVAAPPGLTLYDVQHARESLMGQRGGLLGMLLKESLVRRGGGDRLAARSLKEEVVAMLGTGSVPAQVATESILPSLLPGESRTTRDDQLVPKALREAGLASVQAWSDGSRRALVLRAQDGRMVSVVCNIEQRAGERLCDGLFAGVTLSPVKPGKAK